MAGHQWDATGIDRDVFDPAYTVPAGQPVEPAPEPAPPRPDELASLRTVLGYLTSDVSAALTAARDQYGIGTVKPRTKKAVVVTQLRALDEAVAAVESTLRAHRP